MATEQVEQRVLLVLEKMNELIASHNQVSTGLAILRGVLIDLDMRVGALEQLAGDDHDARLTELRVRLEAAEDLLGTLQINL